MGDEGRGLGTGLSWAEGGVKPRSTCYPPLCPLHHPLSNHPLLLVPILSLAYRLPLRHPLVCTLHTHRLLGAQETVCVFFLKFGSWRGASAISILCGKYRITVNYIEKLDSFTAVIIYLPICLRELAAGEKIKCNLGKKKKITFNLCLAGREPIK